MAVMFASPIQSNKVIGYRQIGTNFDYLHPTDVVHEGNLDRIL
jgi:hypothetical protein